MTPTISTDLCIIGAGSGGLSLAAGAVQMGAKVVLLEGHKMGGDCLNTGCVPSKSLIAAAKQAHVMSRGEPFGVRPVNPEIDFGAAKDHVAAVIAGIEPHDSVERFEGLGVRVITDYGRFVSPRDVEAGSHRIRARRFVIATGSSPLVPPIPGIDATPHLTNESVFDLRDRPEHLLVIGAGPIGLEMAQAHRRLGCQVTVLEGLVALGKDDPELAAIVVEQLRREGIAIHEGAQVAEAAGTEGDIRVTVADGTVHSGTHLLVAVGRKPNTDSLDLEKAGIRTDRGRIQVNASLRTSNRRVYAIGDVGGVYQFTHVAGYHASVVIRSILFGLPAKVSDHHVSWATFTDPELAHVGLDEAAARKRHGDSVEVVRFAYEDNDRARAERATLGMVKVIVHRGRPVGASIVGAQAGEQIQVWALAIANRLKMGAVAAMMSPYPTIGEINKRAAGQYFAPRLFENPWVKRVVRLVQRFG
ncbi:MAG: FAD-dependent oxidoreductase [Paracoccaceae bacterium]|nr:FAD-dependent oxidoreductase [Paracoccaceae bacterium]